MIYSQGVDDIRLRRCKIIRAACTATFSEHLVCAELKSKRSNISVAILAISRLKTKKHYEILTFNRISPVHSTFNFNRITQIADALAIRPQNVRGSFSIQNRSTHAITNKTHVHTDREKTYTFRFNDFTSILLNTISWTFNVSMIVLMPLTTYKYINHVWGCNTYLINTFANQFLHVSLTYHLFVSFRIF